MRKLISLIAVLVVASAFVPLAFAEDDGALSIDVTADFYSKYVWRGQLINDDYVFQPGVSLTYSTDIGDFTGGVWASMDMTGINGEASEIFEADYYFDFTTTLMEGVDGSIGYIYYDFPQGKAGNSQEIYFGLAFDTILSPSVTWYIDTDTASGASYVSVGIGHSFENVIEIMPDVPVGIDLSASLGWGDSEYNNAWWGVNESGLNDLAFSVSLPFEIAGVSVTPVFSWTSILDSDIRDATTEQDQFFTGISLGMSF